MKNSKVDLIMNRQLSQKNWARCDLFVTVLGKVHPLVHMSTDGNVLENAFTVRGNDLTPSIYLCIHFEASSAIFTGQPQPSFRVSLDTEKVKWKA